MSPETKEIRFSSVLRAVDNPSFAAIFFLDGGLALMSKHQGTWLQQDTWYVHWSSGNLVKAQKPEQQLYSQIIQNLINDNNGIKPEESS